MKACPLCAAHLPERASSCWRCGCSAAAPTELTARRPGLRAVAFLGVLLAGAVLALPTLGAQRLADDARASQAWAEFHGAQLREAHEDALAARGPAARAAPRLPPGHPPVRSGQPRLPPGHPPVGSGPGLPPGHPPIGDGESGVPGAPVSPAGPIFEAPRTVDI